MSESSYVIDKAAVAREIEMLRDMLEKFGKTDAEYTHLRGQLAALRKIQREKLGRNDAHMPPRIEETKTDNVRLYA